MRQNPLADDVMASKIVITLRKLASLREYIKLRRFGSAVLCAMERGTGEDENDAMLPTPDPGASVNVSDELPQNLATLGLPTLGALDRVKLQEALHAFLCEASAEASRWDEVARSAQLGLTCIRKLRRTSDNSASLRWRETCFAHMALDARSRFAAATVPKAGLSHAEFTHQVVLQHLADYCKFFSEGISKQSSVSYSMPSFTGQYSFIRLSVQVIFKAGVDFGHRALALRSLNAALRIAIMITHHGGRQKLEREQELDALDGNNANAMAELLKWLLAHKPIGDLTAQRCSSHARASSTHVGKRTRDLEVVASAELDDHPASWSALDHEAWEALVMSCASVAALITLARGDHDAIEDAVKLSHVCLPCLQASVTSPSSAVSPLAHSWEHASNPNNTDTQETTCQRMIAWAIHVHAACLAWRAFATMEYLPLQPDTIASISASDGEVRGVLLAADQTLVHALANCEALATPKRAYQPDHLADILHYSHMRTVVLLILGRPREAASASCAKSSRRLSQWSLSSQPNRASQMNWLHATACATADACCGDFHAALGHFQHALALASSKDAAAALPLFNLLAHYDNAAVNERNNTCWAAALRLSTFLLRADFADGGVHSQGLMPGMTDCRTDFYHSVWFAINASDGAARVIRDRILQPVLARYLVARAHLLCGVCSESAAQFSSLLSQERELRIALKSLGISPHAFLRQAGLAMVMAGLHAEWIERLRAFGVDKLAHLQDLIADALLCDFEPDAALHALECSAGRQRLCTIVQHVDRKVELRLRNNRACLLICARRYREAELELIDCSRTMPDEIAPAYNLALLRVQVGSHDAAAEGWLRFRRWPLDAAPSAYESLAARTLPSTPPQMGESQVSGYVSKASAAELDRVLLRHWATLQSQKRIVAYWRQGCKSALGGTEEPP